MSLYETSDGLFGTHVTWQDVESEMQKTLGTTAKFGDDKTATNISDQKGFLSIIALIHPDWVSTEIPENTHLPRQFIVKIATSLAIIDENQNNEFKENATKIIQEAHNLEVFMYEKLQSYGTSSKNLLTMKIHASRQLTDYNPLKGFIVAEFIPNIHHIGICDAISLEDLKPVVRACAAFSAVGEQMTGKELERTLGEGYVERVVNEFLKHKIENDFANNLKALLLPSRDEDRVHQMIDEFMRIIKIYSSEGVLRKYTSISEYLGHKPVLMHSDIWTSNVLSTSSNDGSIILKALIDFQTVSLSSPGLDVAALLCSFLEKKNRRKYKNKVLDLYYSTFCDEIFNNSATSSIPYTRQQLEDSYDLMLPIDTIFALSTIFRFCLDSTGKDRENAINKVTGLMEDVITTHQTNSERFLDFFDNS